MSVVASLQPLIGNQAVARIVRSAREDRAAPGGKGSPPDVQRAEIVMGLGDYMSIIGDDWATPGRSEVTAVHAELAAYFRYFVASELFDSSPSKRGDPSVVAAFAEYAAAMDALRAVRDRPADEFDAADAQRRVAAATAALRLLVERLNRIELPDDWAALREFVDLPAEYDAFCDKVFANDAIMNSVTEGLDGHIYELYSSGTDPGNLRPEIQHPDNMNLFAEYSRFWKGILMVAGVGRCELQSLGCPLEEALAAWKQWSNLGYSTNGNDFCVQMTNLFGDLVESFVYVTGGGGVATYRVYANLTAASVPRVTARLLREQGVCDFKFAGPSGFGARSEGLVVYCEDRDVAETVADVIGNAATIRSGRPEMTEKRTQSGGIGIGAEPAAVATGMRTTDQYEPHVQSFGMIRSEVLASAVLHFRANRDLAPSLGIRERELFKRFVGLALTGWSAALDPTT